MRDAHHSVLKQKILHELKTFYQWFGPDLVFYTRSSYSSVFFFSPIPNMIPEICKKLCQFVEYRQ